MEHLAALWKFTILRFFSEQLIQVRGTYPRGQGSAVVRALLLTNRGHQLCAPGSSSVKQRWYNSAHLMVLREVNELMHDSAEVTICRGEHLGNVFHYFINGVTRISHMALSKLFNVSMPQLPHLLSRNNSAQ
jgi:hypothetical protein